MSTPSLACWSEIRNAVDRETESGMYGTDDTGAYS